MAEEAKRQPVVDMSSRKIVRIGIVVADVVKTAKRYSDIFCLPSSSERAFLEVGVL